MTKEVYELIHRIYNTMILISTKGEDTVLMAYCLQALNELKQQKPIDLGSKEAE